MKNSLADQAYDTIKKEILHCVLEPGSKFPLADLVERYQYGITPTREAMKLLEQDGYVQAIPRYGYIINPITIEDVQDIFELRAALEKATARLAAERATDEQIQKIMDAVYHQPESEPGPDILPSFMKRNHAFHVTIAKASGNRRLAQALARIMEEQMRILQVHYNYQATEEGLDQDHREIAEAIKNRDADLAEKLIYEDVTCYIYKITSKIKQEQSNRIY